MSKLEFRTVKNFYPNNRGGYGWLTDDGEGELYFQGNCGGTVSSDGKIDTRRSDQIPYPQEGDEIVVLDRGENRQGIMARPWCFKSDWDAAMISSEQSEQDVTLYRIVEEVWHKMRHKAGKSGDITVITDTSPDPHKVLKEVKRAGNVNFNKEWINGSEWTRHSFERLVPGSDEWVRCEENPCHKHRRQRA